MLKGERVPDAATLTDRAREYASPALDQSLIDANARLVDTAEARWPFDPAHLIASARERTGLDDFGGEEFREALTVLCRSADEDLDLNALGRRNLYGQIFDHLVQRLRFVDLWSRVPEILDEPIECPLFIVGLPRSGTTFLQQLLAQDPAMRVTPFWEQLNPLPDHDPAIRPPDDQPLIDRAARNIDGLRRHAPGLLEMHQLNVMDPEEEIYLLGPCFASMVYEWTYILPQYAKWYAEQDFTEGYSFFRKILQTLQWMRGGGRWLLKAPQHMEQVAPLMRVFPDALFIETLRDPVTAAVSQASLAGYGQRIRTDRPNPHAAGRASVAIIERLVYKLLRDQPENDPRFLPIHFAALMADPLRAAQAVYAAAGLKLDPDVRARMQAYVDNNRKGGHSANSYAAEDFSIDIAALRANVAEYYRRFEVVPDPRFN